MMLVSETYSNRIRNHKICQLETLAFIGGKFENRKYKFCISKDCCSYKITYMSNDRLIYRVTNFILVSQTPLNSLIWTSFRLGCDAAGICNLIPTFRDTVRV